MGMAAACRLTFDQAVKKYGIPNTPEWRALYERHVVEMAGWEKSGAIGDTFDDGAV
jgi:hypothetical protein